MAQGNGNQTIENLLEENGNFTTLSTAINATNLTNILSGEGPITVFAPTDDAFSALPIGTVETLLNNTEELRNVLLYHVSSGKLMSQDIINMTNINTLEGQELPVNVTDQGVFVGNAKIITEDIEASNGVIHVIDTVLIPPKKEEPAKWYFFSIPFKAEDDSVENLLSGIEYNAIVYYNSSTGTFENASTIEPLKGYWINVPAGVEFNASKQFSSAVRAQSAALVPPSLKLYPGWNAVGSPLNQNVTAEVAFASIDSSYSKVLGPWVPGASNYQYTGHNGLNGTISNNQLGTDVFGVRPFEGYWVLVRQETLYA